MTLVAAMNLIADRKRWTLEISGDPPGLVVLADIEIEKHIAAVDVKGLRDRARARVARALDGILRRTSPTRLRLLAVGKGDRPDAEAVVCDRVFDLAKARLFDRVNRDGLAALGRLENSDTPLPALAPPRGASWFGQPLRRRRGVDA